MKPSRLSTVALVALSVSLALAPATSHAGFQIARLELTPPGSWMFTVDSPWYSSTRYLAAGLSFDYAHHPLVLQAIDSGGNVQGSTAVVAHQLTGRVEVAGSFLDRVLLSASVPVVLYEAGTALAQVAPIGGPVVGDPRVGALVRLWNHADEDAVSLHAGADLWIPVGAQDRHAGDASLRVLPKVAAAGLLAGHWRWAASVGYLVRPSASIGAEQGQPGNLAGQEVQVGGAFAWTDSARVVSVGPEVRFASTTSRNDALGQRSSGLEILLGAHWQIARTVMLGAGGGVGFLNMPGTPDARALVTLAYAPVRPRPTPQPSVVVDSQPPAAPREIPSPPAPPPAARPPADSDQDGVADGDDACPDTKAGRTPDPARPGCPAPDRDADTVPDASDACPDQPGAPDPAPARNGCPGTVLVRACTIDVAHPVYFATDKDVILDTSDDVLGGVATALRLAPQILHVSVEGHTDSMGGHTHNLDLSARRAASVKRWLVAHGIEAERLESHGFGPDRPIADNQSARGREQNRRVEFRILDEQCR